MRLTKYFLTLSLLVAVLNTNTVSANNKAVCQTKELTKQDAPWTINVPDPKKGLEIKIKSLSGTSKAFVSFKSIDDSVESYNEDVPSWYGEYKEKIEPGIKEIVFQTKENKIAFSFCQ